VFRRPTRHHQSGDEDGERANGRSEGAPPPAATLAVFDDAVIELQILR
jgi:hypothetical protein